MIEVEDICFILFAVTVVTTDLSLTPGLLVSPS